MLLFGEQLRAQNWIDLWPTQMLHGSSLCLWQSEAEVAESVLSPFRLGFLRTSKAGSLAPRGASDKPSPQRGEASSKAPRTLGGREHDKPWLHQKEKGETLSFRPLPQRGEVSSKAPWLVRSTQRAEGLPLGCEKSSSLAFCL